MCSRQGFYPTIKILLITIIAVIAAGAKAQGQDPGRQARTASRLSHPSTASTAKEMAPCVRVTFKDGRISVQAHNCPIQKILNEISNRAELAITSASDVGDERLSENIRDLPLDDALRQVLRSYDAFFFYGIEKGQPAALRAVWVYPKGKGRGFVPVPAEMWESTKELQDKLKDSDPKVRAEAIGALIEREGPQARDALLDALSDPDSGVRSNALYKGMAVGVEVPAETLRDLALNDPWVDVRVLAMNSLAAMNDPGCTISTIPTISFMTRPKKSFSRVMKNLFCSAGRSLSRGAGTDVLLISVTSPLTEQRYSARNRPFHQAVRR